MVYQEEDSVYLSQIIAGILLFKDNFTNIELVNIMNRIYEDFDCDILDGDFMDSDVYKFLEENEFGYKLAECYNHDTIIVVNNKKVLLYDYLKRIVPEKLVKYLADNIYFEQTEKYEKMLSLNKLYGLKKNLIN